MALVRCDNCGRPKGRTRKYTREVEPLNYPDTATICGRLGCNKPGKVWLEAHEWRQYQNKSSWNLPLVLSISLDYNTNNRLFFKF